MEFLLYVLLTIYFSFFILKWIIEPAHMLLFNRPLYVHFYVFPKKMDEAGKAVLRSDFAFYRNLSSVRKVYFEHRVISFIAKYMFIGRNELVVTDEMKIKIAATSVMLSFGMRRYLPTVFEGIIIYPEAFESAGGVLHKGEFNPMAKVVVFSWKDFEEGLAFDNDNINLGLHEFAHVLHFDSVNKRRLGSSGIIFSDAYKEIMAFIADPEKRQKLQESNYLRLYAYTNQFEFIAVTLEYFFETPHEFGQKQPELYAMVQKMINFREG